MYISGLIFDCIYIWSFKHCIHVFSFFTNRLRAIMNFNYMISVINTCVPGQCMPFFVLFRFSFSFFMRAAFSPRILFFLLHARRVFLPDSIRCFSSRPHCFSVLFLLPISRPLLCFSTRIPIFPKPVIHGTPVGLKKKKKKPNNNNSIK